MLLSLSYLQLILYENLTLQLLDTPVIADNSQSLLPLPGHSDYSGLSKPRIKEVLYLSMI